MVARSADDPVCGICSEPRSVHVPTTSGPLTHPREARGEGEYVLVRRPYTMSGCMGAFPGGDDIDMPPVYKFVPAGHRLCGACWTTAAVDGPWDGCYLNRGGLHRDHVGA